MANLPPTAGFINSFKSDNPIDANKVFGGNNWLQFLQEVIKDNQFPISEDGSSNGWDIALTVKASEVNTLQGISVTDPIITLPVGTPVLFYLDVAPPTWTILQAVDEHSTRLTKGLAAGGQEGGLSGGNLNFSSVFDVVNTSAKPNHTHTVIGSTAAPAGANTRGSDSNGPVQNHTHSINITSGGAGSHDHTVDLAVKWAACIIATKD